MNKLTKGIFLILGMNFYLAQNNSEVFSQKTLSGFPFVSVEPPLPKSLSFAGESIPLDDPDIHESFDLELIKNTYWQSNTMLALKRAKRYFPIIEPILKAYRIPNDFKYLAVIESNLDPLAVSPAGARGIWQFMPAAAKQYGLEVNGFVDERYQVEKATHAACLYLEDAYRKFGNWALAAAAYNAGGAGIDKQINRQELTNNSYFNLTLNAETARYVFRILSMKSIMENPKKYGYLLDENSGYPTIETETLYISTSIENLAYWAKQNGMNYKILKYLNPWIRDIRLPNNQGKSYAIKRPKKNVFKRNL